MNLIDRAWKLQYRIEKHLILSEKTVVIICSFFTGMVFYWAGSMMCVSWFDLIIIYCGTLCLLLVPVVVYVIKNRNKRNSG